MNDAKDRIIDAALTDVPFDGWSEVTFRTAIEDANIPNVEARALFPRGAIDLALAFHMRGDAAMVAALEETDLTALRFRDRVAYAIRKRLDLVEQNKEAVRRGVTLFSLPLYAAEGARTLWHTSDAIWTALGDTSDDLNWYTKRATLAGVYAATVLYWLSDRSHDHTATWSFLDRRIEDVMRFETLKTQARKNPLLKPFLAGPEWLAQRIKAPNIASRDLPGRWQG